MALLLAGADCSPRHGRLIERDGAALAIELAVYDHQLTRTIGTEPLNPKPLAGVNPPGITIAHIDSGVVYTRPDIARRIARSPSGHVAVCICPYVCFISLSDNCHPGHG